MHEACDDPAHDFRVHLRVDYIVEIHAVNAAEAKEYAEELSSNGAYDLGDMAEAIDVWVNEPGLYGG